MNESTPQQVDFMSAIHTSDAQPSPACTIVIFGASGDLTKRLLMPSLFHLYNDGLLAKDVSILGLAIEDYHTASFREKMKADILTYSNRDNDDEDVAWDVFSQRIHYMQGNFDAVETFENLRGFLDCHHSNVLFYMATPPSVFGMISDGLKAVGLNRESTGWRRIIVEKPFGTDLASAKTLNQEILSYWEESQVYRIDHYLGKEAVQNLIAFRFANGMFEPLWNRTHIDHIQITAAEQVGVEWRGGYYDKSGVIRDMVQNHLFQMMAYLCMEPPTSFDAESIRNEKHKLLNTVRLMEHDEVHEHAVRGQYDKGLTSDGLPAKAYRDEPHVAADSNTETFAALKLRIDNWRWDGVPVFLRSGKGMDSKATEIVVQFKQAPEFTFRGTPAAEQLEANQLIFRIQPQEGIELHFLAKRPGPSMNLRKVNMSFEYDEAFVAQPGTGYETMLYDCIRGDASLFSRTDWVETAWKIVQPVLDVWGNEKAEDLPNYPFGSWGPKAAFELLAPTHRSWLARSPKQALERVPIFEGSGKTTLKAFAMMLKPVVFNEGDLLVEHGSQGNTLFIIEKGTVELVDAQGKVLTELTGGQVFGELSMLITKKVKADVYAKTYCALYAMNKRDFCKVLMDRPVFAERIMQVARERYNVIVDAAEWLETEANPHDS